MNTKWVGIVLLGVMVSTLSLAARTANPSYLSNIDEKWIVGVDKYPQWELGVNGSTWQDWTSDSDGFWDVDEDYNNDYGGGNIIPWAFIERNADIDGKFSQDTGVYIEIPNVLSSLQKTVWIEVIYQGNLKINPGDIYENIGLYNGRDTDDNLLSVGVDQFYNVSTQIDDQGISWKVLTIGWTMNTSPSMEWIVFNAVGTDLISGQVKSVSVDTLSHVVPAPGAVVLAGLGTAIVGYFRRKY